MNIKQKKIGARVKGTITVDGLVFKDLYGDGELKPYEDWRLSSEERAKDLVSRMTPEEKAGLMVIGDQRMGISAGPEDPTSHDGILNESWPKNLAYASLFPTTRQLVERHVRHMIVRENARPSEFALWINTMQEVCEASRLGIPCIVAANSKNESADLRYNASDEPNRFTTFPSTLGMAATFDPELIHRFGEIGHREFLASGIRKAYMYMADCATDPRWFRTFGTFGENPEQISAIISDLVTCYQGPAVGEDSVALTVKHFPGGGARDNGFDPHYAEGKYNIYATPGSLEKYHLPPFKAAIAAGASSIMPYYAIPNNEKSAVPQAPFAEPFDDQSAFAYNRSFITGLLRGELGFQGYVNSDSGVLRDMAWGAEELSFTERIRKLLEAGTDIVSGESDPEPFIEAFTSGEIPESLIDAALVRQLKELFDLGLFEDPYVSVETADEQVNTEDSRQIAYQAHLKSVVLLKAPAQPVSAQLVSDTKGNNILCPESADASKTAISGLVSDTKGKKFYAELLCKTDYTEQELALMALSGSAADPEETKRQWTRSLREAYPEIAWVDDPEDADTAILFLKPASGSYFAATPTYLDLQIHKETGVDLQRIREIRDQVDTLMIHVNLVLPFLLNEVEPLADVLTVGFSTFSGAAMDVLLGKAPHTGRLPITLPCPEGTFIDENGISISPNDVPGYDKELYMKGTPYAYTDSCGNRYVYGFGL